MVPTTECIAIPSQLCDDVVEELCEEKCTPVWWCKVGRTEFFRLNLCRNIFFRLNVWEHLFDKKYSITHHPIPRCAPMTWRSFLGV